MAAASINGIVINEIGYVNNRFDTNGNGFTFDDQFVELYNSTGAPVDISGWEIREITSLIHTIGNGTIVPAGGYFTSANPTFSGTPTPTPNVLGGLSEYADSNYNLSDTDVITLYDPVSDTFIVLAGDDSTGTGLTNAINAVLAAHPNAMQVGMTETGVEDEADTSMGRDGDGADTWTTAPPTPGAANLCFCAGTRVATPCGDAAIETLCIGDMVHTADGRAVPVKWIGRQIVSTRFGPAERLLPVRVRAGALGNGLPMRDLTLTADHALLIDGLLVNAGALVNGTPIDYVSLSELGESYTVYHIETENHDVILAEGAPAETYIDYVGRQAFDNYAEYVSLYGEARPIAEMPYARISSARLLLPALKRWLAQGVAA